jgi:glycosyltransferase involved in cell wall biosynthesis
MPVVLVEALAVHTPVVATDCPSGPREILTDSRLGTLVPVGGVEPMAEAIEDRLGGEGEKPDFELAVAPFGIEAGTRAYLDALGIGYPIGEGSTAVASDHE